MKRNRRRVFVVSFVAEDGRRVYFAGEELHPLGTVQGLFSTDLVYAEKFRDEETAKRTASHYKGAGVECIKEGERLK